MFSISYSAHSYCLLSPTIELVKLSLISRVYFDIKTYCAKIIRWIIHCLFHLNLSDTSIASGPLVTRHVLCCHNSQHGSVILQQWDTFVCVARTEHCLHLTMEHSTLNKKSCNNVQRQKLLFILRQFICCSFWLTEYISVLTYKNV